MPAKLKSNRHLEIAHVLFIDVVGYSKLLVNEQREVLQELNQLVRKTPQLRKSDRGGKRICIPSGDGMAKVIDDSGLMFGGAAQGISSIGREAPIKIEIEATQAR